MEPGRKWVLESGRVYEISLLVYDRDRHPIHLSDVSISQWTKRWTSMQCHVVFFIAIILKLIILLLLLTLLEPMVMSNYLFLRSCFVNKIVSLKAHI